MNRIGYIADPVYKNDVMTLNYYNNLKKSGTLQISSSYVLLGYAWNCIKFYITLVSGAASQAQEVSIICNRNISSPSYFAIGLRFDNGLITYATSTTTAVFGIGWLNLQIINGYLYISNSNISSSLYYTVL